MITAVEARQKLNQHNGRQKALEYCQKYIEIAINEAIEKGYDSTSFNPVCTTIDGKFYDLEEELATWLKNNGYKLEPKPYSRSDGKNIRW